MDGQRTETQATEEQWSDGLDLIFWALNYLRDPLSEEEE